MSCTSVFSASGGPVHPTLPPPPPNPEKASAETLNRILETLLQQQADLRKVVDQQADLSSVMQRQQEAICKKLDTLEELRLHPLFGGGPAGGIYDAAQDPLFPQQGQAEVKDQGKAKNNRIKTSKSRSMSAGGPPRSLSQEGCPDEEKALTERLRSLIMSMRFDMATGVVIGVNVIVVFWELEQKGYRNGYELDMHDAQVDWEGQVRMFEAVEFVFNIFYLLELVLRLWASRERYCTDKINVLDAMIVACCSLEIFLLRPLGLTSSGNMNVVRILRMIRLLKLMKFLRLLNTMSELRILLKTLSISVGSLVWSMCLVAVLVVAAGFLMFVWVEAYIEDAMFDLSTKRWLYEHFGTCARSCYTMFEATFSAAWAPKAWTIVNTVSPSFAIFWIVYIVTVNFAVMRIVAALFLKQTMAVASIDADRMAMENMKQKEKFAASLRECFTMADTSGDGVITQAEFEAMVEDRQIVAQFEHIDIDVEEVAMLFEVLSDDDGEVDYEEFLAGALKMKNVSRCIDTIQILHELATIKHRSGGLNVMEKQLDAMSEKVDKVFSCLRPLLSRKDAIS